MSNAPLVINSLEDFDDGNINNGVTTLREAIQRANTVAGDDDIDLSGLDGTLTLTAALPNINSNIDFIGPGAGQLTIDGNNSFRPFLSSKAGLLFRT